MQSTSSKREAYRKLRPRRLFMGLSTTSKELCIFIANRMTYLCIRRGQHEHALPCCGVAYTRMFFYCVQEGFAMNEDLLSSNPVVQVDKTFAHRQRLYTE
jgi:hypothetical protein